MKMGRRLGERVGWPAGPGALPQTVEVRIIRGRYVPCQGCHWYSVCIVPKGQFNATQRKAEVRNIYQCIDFIDRNSQGYQEWYRAPYLPSRRRPF